MGVTEIKTKAQFDEAIKGSKPVAIDFWATWCGPCKAISPVFADLSENIDTIDFYKIDVDEVEDVAQEVGIRAMPTFMIFKDGEKVNELVGAHPQKLHTFLQEAN